MKDRDVKAIVLPIPSFFSGRLKSRTEFVLAKFFPRKRMPIYINRGTIVVIYLSRESKKLVGEGVVSKVVSVPACEVWKTFGEDMLASRREYLDYVGDRMEDSICVMRIGEVESYERPVSSPWPITMTGKYLNSTEYETIRDRSSRR